MISAGTRRLVGSLFEYHDLGAIDVKGIAAPVPAWQVLRPSAVVSRFETMHGSPPFVLPGGVRFAPESQVRTRLSAGGRWIRTFGSWLRDPQTVTGDGTALEKGADLSGNGRFESISLQRGVECELDNCLPSAVFQPP